MRPKRAERAYFDSPKPRILAHRGLAVDCPENTLLAFLKALATGAGYIETDVHASVDGVAIISHDPDLRRIANRDERIDQLTAARLQAIDLGQQQGFATLSEAFEAFPDARFNIDIKSDAAVQPTVTAIRRARAVDRVLVTSFDGRRTRAAAAGIPGVATSASALRTAVILLALAVGSRSVAQRALSSVDALQVPERWHGIRVLSPAVLRAAAASGVEVHVWTVNSPVDMRRLLQLGVDGIVTDRADLAVQTVHRAR